MKTIISARKNYEKLAQTRLKKDIKYTNHHQYLQIEDIKQTALFLFLDSIGLCENESQEIMTNIGSDGVFFKDIDGFAFFIRTKFFTKGKIKSELLAKSASLFEKAGYIRYNLDPMLFCIGKLNEEIYQCTRFYTMTIPDQISALGKDGKNGRRSDIANIRYETIENPAPTKINLLKEDIAKLLTQNECENIMQYCGFINKGKSMVFYDANAFQKLANLDFTKYLPESCILDKNPSLY